VVQAPSLLGTFSPVSAKSIQRYAFYMRILAVALLFATALAAQRGRGGFSGPVGGGHRPGFSGGMGYRGPAGPSHGWSRGSQHPGIGFRVRQAYQPPFYSGYGYVNPWGWGGSYYPFGWYSAPLWTTPALYAAPDDYPSNPGPNVTIITVPSAPAVGYDPPPRRAAPPPAPEPEEERPLATESWAYLIAAKDGTVWLARDYSVENGIIHLTVGAERKQMPLAQIDRTATEQLNRERGVDVRLP
jgi:hypothetical protein